MSYALSLGDLPPAVVSTIAQTIQNVEGYYPGSLAYINNNPGNLIYVGQSGATVGQGKAGTYSFARFPSYEAGLQALYDQVNIYALQGLTIQQMMDRYAPAGAGNNPQAYAQMIADQFGVTPDTPLTALLSMPGPDLSLPDQPSVFADVSGPVLALAGGLLALALLMR